MFVRGQILSFSRTTAEILALLLQTISLVTALSSSQNDACIRTYDRPTTSLVVNHKIIEAVVKNLIRIDMRPSMTLKTKKFAVMSQVTA